MDEEGKKAIIKYPEDCMCCDYCELDFPQNAIYVSPIRYVPILTSCMMESGHPHLGNGKLDKWGLCQGHHQSSMLLLDV
jgi:hypothetical protein